VLSMPTRGLCERCLEGAGAALRRARACFVLWRQNDAWLKLNRRVSEKKSTKSEAHNLYTFATSKYDTSLEFLRVRAVAQERRAITERDKATCRFQATGGPAGAGPASGCPATRTSTGARRTRMAESKMPLSPPTFFLPPEKGMGALEGGKYMRVCVCSART
jgi:hypothetical protein